MCGRNCEVGAHEVKSGEVHRLTIITSNVAVFFVCFKERADAHNIKALRVEQHVSRDHLHACRNSRVERFDRQGNPFLKPTITSLSSIFLDDSASHKSASAPIPPVLAVVPSLITFSRGNPLAVAQRSLRTRQQSKEDIVQDQDRRVLTNA